MGRLQGKPPNPRFGESFVHAGVVDDLTGDEDAPIRKSAARLVSILNRARHPVAEAELAREEDRGPVRFEPEVVGFEPLHDAAVVLPLEDREGTPPAGGIAVGA